MKKLKFEQLILFEDNNYLIVNKPWGISSLADRNADINIHGLAKNYNEDLVLCHRLDKETSGILVLAKNKDAHRHISLQFENRKTNKIYHALIDGTERYEYIMYSAPIKPMKNAVVRIDALEGKEAHTIFNTIEIFKHHALVECNPITGRMHQIRIHLANLETPISGDSLYGGEPVLLSDYKRNYVISKYGEEKPLMGRVALHARKISFDDFNGTSLEFEAPYPKDFEVMLKQIRKYDFK